MIYYDKIVSIEDINDETRYDFSVEDNENYFCQDILVHNCRALGVDFVTLQTRNGKLHVSCPHILKDISKFQDEFPDYILDGELYNHDLKHDFERLMSMIRKSKKLTEEDILETKENVFFYVYDVITPEPMTFEERQKFLRDNVYGKYATIKEVETVIVNNKEELDTKLGEFLVDGFEGAMIRNLKSYYESGRSKNLIKYKMFVDIEVEVVDVNEGLGVWAGKAKRVTVRHKETGIVQDSGIRGSFEHLKNVFDNKEKYIGGDATLRFQRYSDDGKFIFPVITYLWGTKRDI